MTTTRITVLAPEAFRAPMDRLALAYAEFCGQVVDMIYGPASGSSAHSITQRLAHSEVADVVVLPEALLDAQVVNGHVAPEGHVRLMRSLIGLCSRADRPAPNISTAHALRDALLQAGSVAISNAGSGTYVAQQLLPRLGIVEQMQAKVHRVADEPIGAVVARGEFDLGFQQVSELLAVPGAQFAGPLPAELQQATTISAGVARGSCQPELARRLLGFLQSASSMAVFASAGLEPAASD